MITKEDFTRISNDVNGNPRYVCHFLDVLTDAEHEQLYKEYGRSILGTDHIYNTAVKKANKIGGRKYHTKAYGGGIVFQSYNLQETCNNINAL